MGRRYLIITLDDEWLIRWQLGLDILASLIAREMRRLEAEVWPELADVRYTHGGAQLLFVWPEGYRPAIVD